MDGMVVALRDWSHNFPRGRDHCQSSPALYIYSAVKFFKLFLDRVMIIVTSIQASSLFFF